MSFSELGLSEKVLEAVAAAGYTSPTPIQAQAIPPALERRDVLGIAQTGTGKTAAFTLPMLNRLETGRARARMPRTLILEPTRELAAQVEESFTRLGASHKLSVALLIGGVSFADQDAKITRGVDVLIATPGRLLDHFERGKLLLTGIEILVIDEADRMLDMGFIPDIERICKMVPFTRQTLFFSATMPPEIQRLTEAFLSNPVKIEVARPASTASTITQRLVASGAEAHDKRDVLRRLIRDATDLQNAIIFCNRKRDVAILYRSLEKHGFNVVALHGDMDQMSRMQALDKFRNGGASLLVASDVAARGLDIPEVSHVFNFDVPFHPEDYVHRIGRTGRAGRTGHAASIVTSHDVKALAAIESLTGKPIEWEGPTLDELLAERPDLAESDSRHDRRRGSSRGEGRERRDSRGERRSSSRSEGTRAQQGRHEAARDEQPRSQHARPEAARRDGGRADTARQEPARREPVRAGDRHLPSRFRRDDDELPVVGFGDHIPAFLLQKVDLRLLTAETDLSADEETIDDETVDEIAAEREAPQDAAEPATEQRSSRRKRTRKPRSIEIREAGDGGEAVAEAVAGEQEPPAAAAAEPRPEAEAPEPAADVAAEGTPEAAEAPEPKPARRTRKKAAVTEASAETAPAAEEAPAKPARSRRKKAEAASEAAAAPEAEAPVATGTVDEAGEAAPAAKPRRTRKAKAAVEEPTGEEPAVEAAAEKPARKTVTRRKAAAAVDEASVADKPTRKPRRKAAAVEAADADQPGSDGAASASAEPAAQSGDADALSPAGAQASDA